MYIRNFLRKIVVSGAILSLVFGSFSISRAAITPILTITRLAENSAQITVTGDPNAQVQLYYYAGGYGQTPTVRSLGNTNNAGTLTLTIIPSLYSIPTGSPVQAVVNGTFSTAQNWPSFTGNPNNSGSLTVSQSTVNIAPGQSAIITTNGSNLYINNNSNSLIASATVLSGSQFGVTANQIGTTSVQVCSGNLGCNTVVVNVGYNNNNNNNSINLGQSYVNMSVGQYLTVTASASEQLYISTNSSPSVATASITGNQLNLNGVANGTTFITVCGNYSGCATVTVVVGNNNNNNGTVSLNQSNLSLTNGQSATVYVYAPQTVYISTNSNSSVASASVQNNQLSVTGLSTGSTTITVCANGSNCASLYVTVNGQYSSITLNPSSITVSSGQTYSVYVSGASGSGYYISTNSNSSVATASISGSMVTVTGQNAGATQVSVCQYNISACATLYVTVSGYNSSLTVSPSSVSLSSGQTYTASISGNNNTVYVSSNSNSSVASASLSGNTLSVYGIAQGSTQITVCQNNSSSCATVYVTVNASPLPYNPAPTRVKQRRTTVNPPQYTTPVTPGNGVLTPSNNQVYTNFPRQLTVTWANDGQANHTIEVTCDYCASNTKWSETPRVYTASNYATSLSSIMLPGDNQYRLRIRSNNGSWSDYTYFTFKTSNR